MSRKHPKRKWLYTSLTAFALLLILLIIVLNSGPTKISRIQLARDFQDDKITGVATVFAPTDNPLHCVVSLSHSARGTRLKFVWTVLEGGNQNNYKLSEREIVLERPQATVDNFLQLDQPWPVGLYKVEVSLDDGLPQSLTFSISNAAKIKTELLKRWTDSGI